MKLKKETEFVTKNYYEMDSVPLSTLTNVSNFKNGDDLLAFYLSNKTCISGVFSKETTVNQEGIITKQKYQELIENPHDVNLMKNTTGVYFVNKDYLKYLSKYGQYGSLAKLENQKECSMNDFFNEKPFSDGEKEENEFIEYIKNKKGQVCIKNSDGQYFMSPFILNYIGADLDNKNYHLDEMVEYLIQRDDLAFIIENNYDKKLIKCPIVGAVDGLDKIIADIPYYNAEDDCSETINLVYYPKSEEVQKIMNWELEKNNPEIWNVDNYIVRVILGCEKFRVNPIVEEQKEVPKRKFKS